MTTQSHLLGVVLLALGQGRAQAEQRGTEYRAIPARWCNPKLELLAGKTSRRDGRRRGNLSSKEVGGILQKTKPDSTTNERGKGLDGKWAPMKTVYQHSRHTD